MRLCDRVDEAGPVACATVSVTCAARDHGSGPSLKPLNPSLRSPAPSLKPPDPSLKPPERRRRGDGEWSIRPSRRLHRSALMRRATCTWWGGTGQRPASAASLTSADAVVVVLAVGTSCKRLSQVMAKDLAIRPIPSSIRAGFAFEKLRRNVFWTEPFRLVSAIGWSFGAATKATRAHAPYRAGSERRFASRARIPPIAIGTSPFARYPGLRTSSPPLDDFKFKRLVGACVCGLDPTVVPKPNTNTPVLLVLNDPSAVRRRLEHPTMIEGEQAPSPPV